MLKECRVSDPQSTKSETWSVVNEGSLVEKCYLGLDPGALERHHGAFGMVDGG